MAAQTTALTEFSDNGDSRTYTFTGHSVVKPKLVIQKRKVPGVNGKVAETSVSVICGTEDSLGAYLPEKVSFQVIVRTPINGITTDVDAALAVFRDIMAGDEFGFSIPTQNFLV
jgi:hypothetical protein